MAIVFAIYSRSLFTTSMSICKPQKPSSSDTRLASSTDASPTVLVAGATNGSGLSKYLAAVVVVGATAFLLRPYDRDMVERVANRAYFDFELYRWLVANTQPNDLFVTDVLDDYHAPAAQSVFSAGRRLVAAQRIHSNPYLDWVERNRRRLAYYRAAIGKSDASPAELCLLAAEAGPGASAYVIIPNGLRPGSLLGSSLFKSRENAVFEINRGGCR